MTRCIIVFVFGLFPFLIKGQDSGSQTIIGTKKPVAFGFSAGGYLTAIDESYKSPSFDLVPIIRVSPKRIGFFFETGLGYRFYRHKFDVWPGPGFFVPGVYEIPTVVVEFEHTLITPILVGKKFYHHRDISVVFLGGVNSLWHQPSTIIKNIKRGHFDSYLQDKQWLLYQAEVGLSFSNIKFFESVSIVAEKEASLKWQLRQNFLGINAKFMLN